MEGFFKVPHYFENGEIFSVGEYDNHAYFIPFGDEKTAFSDDREKSDRFTSLNGSWSFKYYSSVYEIDDDLTSIDLGGKGFCRMPVPSAWQNHGFDKRQYTNVRYPFPFDPPYVPWDNPCGVYTKKVNIKLLRGRQFICFEGVDSAFYLYVNGKEVGYAQITHAIHEFEITEFLHDGENTITVLVLKWCDGSYLEDQDKFRFSGIIGEVYLVNRDNAFIKNYKIKTENSGKIRISFETDGEAGDVFLALYDGKKKLGECTAHKGEAIFSVSEPRLWNAENPYLYTVLIHSGSEYILDYVGFRDIKIENGIFYLNSQNIKLHGVNRHDSYPDTGPVASMENIGKDLKMMKQFGINAIRTSHYPNRPEFYRLCDKMGFYVISESDLETHGSVVLGNDESWWDKTMATVMEIEFFRAQVAERSMKNVSPQINRPSVIAWSLGNESGFGVCIVDAAEAVRAADDTRPVHYERECTLPDKKYDFEKYTDFKSVMYYSPEECKTICEKKEKRPFLLCEYAHAMGNSPGDLAEYDEVMEKYDNFLGGFIWEWCDHAVVLGRNILGKERYGYGGDSGEPIHDGNFCIDGLVYPDRRPHTGLYEYKNVIKPCEVKMLDRGLYRFKNRYDFTVLNDKVNAEYVVEKRGVKVGSGKIPLPGIAPHDIAEINIPVDEYKGADLFIRIIFTEKSGTPFVPKGHIIGYSQFDISTEERALLPVEDKDFGSSVSETETEIVIGTRSFKYIYSKKTATWKSLTVGSRTVNTKPFDFIVGRAPTDNERKLVKEYEKFFYYDAKARGYETLCEKFTDKIVIRSGFSVCGYAFDPIVSGTVEYTVHSGGEIDISVSADRNTVMQYLPRFGMRMFLKNGFSRVKYFGYGPYESYEDKNRASYKSLFCEDVQDMHEDYIKPQENGSHFGCDFVEITDRDLTVRVESDKAFSFNASEYTFEELKNKKHNFELEKSGDSVLCIDYRMSGIGSYSCGPELDRRYRLEEEHFEYGFRLTFINN